MTFLKVLGTAQDGGYPHTGCPNKCCEVPRIDPTKKRLVSSIALIDEEERKFWLFDISPDLKNQLTMIDSSYSFAGIFLTHAHVGHYLGLFELGLEIMNVENVPVYAMPQMTQFLKNNTSLSFIIDSGNINLEPILENKLIEIKKNINVAPFLVPHRNELSETVGYKITSTSKSIVYLPDIDSWDEWDTDIIDIINENDMLFLDGTFYDKSEIKSRNINKIPHPSIKDSLLYFKNLDKEDRKKVFFTHLNHTNKLLDNTSEEYLNLIGQGYNIAQDGIVVKL